MKQLQDYIKESEQWVESPAAGDDFAINIREECLVESHIVDVVEDGIVLAADDKMMSILENYGMLEGSSKDKIAKQGVAEDPVTGGLIGLAIGAKGAYHAGKKAAQRGFDSDVPMHKAAGRYVKDFAQGVIDPRTYIPKKKNQDVAEGSQSQVRDILRAIKSTKRERAEWVRRGYDVAELDQDLDALEQSLADAEQRWKQTDRAREVDEGLNTKQIKRDLDSGMSHDAVIGKHANKKLSNTDQIRQIIKQHAWDKRMNSKRELGEQQEMQRLRELSGMPAKAPQVTEGGVKNWVDDLYYEFKEKYDLPWDIDDDAYLSVVAKFLNSQGIDPDKIEDIGELFLDMRERDEDNDHDYANRLDAEQYDDEDMMEGSTPEIDYDSLVVDGIDTRDYPDFSDAYFASGEYMDGTPLPDEVLDELGNDHMLLRQHLEKQIYEAKYQGREVSLGKPFLTPDGPKKRSVYVKNPKGNVVKVNFGDKKLRIKKSNPKRRKSFRARHRCANPGPRHKARYWSCRAW